MITWLDSPNVLTTGVKALPSASTNTSLRDSATSLTSTLWSKRTWNERPPTKSTPRLRPFVNRDAKPITITIDDTMYAKRRLDKKSKLMFVYQFSVVFVEKATFFFLPNRLSNTTREIKSAENKEVRIPMISVVAKPRIGPVPKEYRIIPTISVVTLASIIALFEFL